LTDTDILIDAFHALPQAMAHLATQQAAGGLTISLVGAMEMVAGCRNAVELSHWQKFVQRVTVWPITPAVSDNAYQLMEYFALSHGLTIPDALIAATARENGLTLYTRNVRHFQMIPALTVVPPY
jgi:predicted nucleic acid-binding protein